MTIDVTGPEYPDLTPAEQKTQLDQLHLATRMAVPAGMRAYSEAAHFQRYQNLAPATKTRAEITRALAWLISRGLITVAPGESWQHWFSADYDLPEHLQREIDDYLLHAFGRGF